jgi:hypothetical protein
MRKSVLKCELPNKYSSYKLPPPPTAENPGGAYDSVNMILDSAHYLWNI